MNARPHTACSPSHDDAATWPAWEFNPPVPPYREPGPLLPAFTLRLAARDAAEGLAFALAACAVVGWFAFIL